MLFRRLGESSFERVQNEEPPSVNSFLSFLFSLGSLPHVPWILRPPYCFSVSIPLLILVLHQMLAPHISKILSKTQVGSLSRLVSPAEMNFSGATISLLAFTVLCCLKTVYGASLVLWQRSPGLSALCSPSAMPGTREIPVCCWFYFILSYYTPCFFLLLSRLCLYSLYFICSDIPH